MTYEEMVEPYIFIKRFADSRICGILPLLYHWTMHVDISEWGYEDRYCYQTKELAIAALKEWNGKGDPKNWHRHPKTGRRRNPETGEEWIAP